MKTININDIEFIKISAINGRDFLDYAIAEISNKYQISENEVLSQYIINKTTLP